MGGSAVQKQGRWCSGTLLGLSWLCGAAPTAASRQSSALGQEHITEPPSLGLCPRPLPTPLPSLHAWHCLTPPTPACSRTIFQMDVSILLLVIKTRGQRCLAQLCTEGAGHSPDPPQLHGPGQQLAPCTEQASKRQRPTLLHPRLAAGAVSHSSLFFSWGGPRGAHPMAVPASALRPDAGCQLASGPCGGQHRTGPGMGR